MTRLDEHRFQVVTLSPLVLDAADFELAPGIDDPAQAGRRRQYRAFGAVGAVLIFTSR